MYPKVFTFACTLALGVPCACSTAQGNDGSGELPQTESVPESSSRTADATSADEVAATTMKSTTPARQARTSYVAEDELRSLLISAPMATVPAPEATRTPGAEFYLRDGSWEGLVAFPTFAPMRELGTWSVVGDLVRVTKETGGESRRFRLRVSGPDQYDLVEDGCPDEAATRTVVFRN